MAHHGVHSKQIVFDGLQLPMGLLAKICAGKIYSLHFDGVSDEKCFSMNISLNNDNNPKIWRYIALWSCPCIQYNAMRETEALWRVLFRV